MFVCVSVTVSVYVKSVSVSVYEKSVGIRVSMCHLVGRDECVRRENSLML